MIHNIVVFIGLVVAWTCDHAVGYLKGQKDAIEKLGEL